MSLLREILKEESQIADGGFTLGALNRHQHSAVIGNARHDGGVITLETGHLRFERGKGIVKSEEATCSLCAIDGLNDGQWHDPSKMTMPKSE